MSEPSRQIPEIQRWIEQLVEGEESAREELYNFECERLFQLTRGVDRGFRQVGLEGQARDVYQNARHRLWQALQEAEIKNARRFFRLAAMQIRREVIDMLHFCQDAQTTAARQSEQAPPGADEGRPREAIDGAATTLDPQKLSDWGELHRIIESLPEELREVVDLLWYHGLSREQAAALLDVDERTIRRLWRAARLELHESFAGRLPKA